MIGVAVLLILVILCVGVRSRLPRNPKDWP